MKSAYNALLIPHRSIKRQLELSVTRLDPLAICRAHVGRNGLYRRSRRNTTIEGRNETAILEFASRQTALWNRKWTIKILNKLPHSLKTNCLI